jgi:hypothetical protein
MVRVRGIVDVVTAAMDLGGLTARDRWIRDFIVVLMSPWVLQLVYMIVYRISSL